MTRRTSRDSSSLHPADLARLVKSAREWFEAFGHQVTLRDCVTPAAGERYLRKPRGWLATQRAKGRDPLPLAGSSDQEGRGLDGVYWYEISTLVRYQHNPRREGIETYARDDDAPRQTPAPMTTQRRTAR